MFSEMFIDIIKSLLLPSYLVLEVIGILFAIEAIFKSRSSQSAIGWALGLVFLPPLVLPLYILFGGRRFYGYVEARRQGDQEIQKSAQAIIEDMSQRYGLGSQAIAQHLLLEELALMPFTKGNSVALYADGEDAFAAMFQAIERAERYILLQFYIVRDDRLGRALAERLIEKARQGVRVYFLYDQIGSFALSGKFVRKLKRGGVDIRAFSALRWNFKGRLQVNFRNHRKILLIDGEEAFVGGLNVGVEYCHGHRRLTPWRDTQVQFKGPVVSGVQLAFIEDWFWQAETELDLHWSPQQQPEDIKALALPTGPADYHDTCQLMFVNAINRAKQRIWIVSPYFVPDDAIIKALKLASFRGVDVRVLLPGIVDSRVVQLSSFNFVDELRHNDVKFFQYQKGFLHQKVILLDDETSYIGTANLDNRSFRLNFELTMVIVDKGFNQQVEAMLQQDFADSLELDSNFVQGKSLGFRFQVKLARLFAPVQ